MLTKDDNNNEFRCLATNPLFDEINKVIAAPSDGFSSAHIFNVTCKHPEHIVTHSEIINF